MSNFEQITRTKIDQELLDEEVVGSGDIVISFGSLEEEWPYEIRTGLYPISRYPSGRILVGFSLPQDPDAGLVWTVFPENKKPEIHQIWVVEDLRRKGVAQQLVDIYEKFIDRPAVFKGPFSKAGSAFVSSLKKPPMNSNPNLWYRVDLPQAPQGHGLTTDFDDVSFTTYELEDGSWIVWSIDDDGKESDGVTLDSFADVRRSIETIMLAAANPSLQANPKRYIKAGAGALLGTVAGTLLGGLPGIALNHTALAAVGAQAGGILGAASGAVLADKIKLKSKLLR